MSEESFFKKIYSAFFRQEFPADLVLAVVWLAASIVAIYLPILNETPVRYVLTIPVVLFIPGYCLIAALFPRVGDLTLLERIALAFGLSIVIVPFIGLGLNFTPLGIRLDPIVISLILFTWVMILVAHYRRAILPVEERFKIPFSNIVGTIRDGIFPSESSKIDRLLSSILVFVIIIAIITTIYVIASPREGEHFSEFFILGENHTAADYPDQIVAGHDYPLFIGIGNHEYRNTNYTIEIWMLHTEFDNRTNTSTIVLMDPNDRLSLTLGHNETRIIPYNLSVQKTEYNRVEFLLFKEALPSPDIIGNDRINASYHSLNLGVSIR